MLSERGEQHVGAGGTEPVSSRGGVGVYESVMAAVGPDLLEAHLTTRIGAEIPSGRCHTPSAYEN